MIFKSLSIAAFACSLFAIAYSHYSKPKLAFIDMTEVYEGFELKHQLDQKTKGINDLIDNQLDSIKFLFETHYKELEEQNKKVEEDETLRLLSQNFQYKTQQKEEIEERLVRENNEQVWKRLNIYIKDYGTKHNYNFILGANGLGSIMYAGKPEDITNEIIQYVNEQYKGN